MTTYQTYDFIKDLNFHIANKYPIDLLSKSEIFKIFLFKLKTFQLTEKIKINHPIFYEDYFLYILYNTVFVSKKLDYISLKFDCVEVLNGLKVIRKMKLEKIYK